MPALLVIERQFKNEILFMGDSLSRLEARTKEMSHDTITDNEYLKLLELYSKVYIKNKENKKLAYCILRMQQICEAKKHRYLQRYYQQVTFTKMEDMETQTQNFMSRQKKYLKIRQERSLKPLLILDAIIYCFTLILFVYGFHCSFLFSFLFSLSLWLILLLFSYFFAIESIIKDQMEELWNFMDPILVDFEIKHNSSSFKLFHKHKK